MPPALETDYLVVGAGLAGMAFVDSLLDATDADIVMADRRHAPGGHWLDAYPFVRLHQPSAWYGVGSAGLDDDRLEVSGDEAGQYARVSGVELQAYFARVMRDRFLASGRVRYLPMSEHRGDGRVRSLVGAGETEVRARRAVVDATYTPSETPETYAPPFLVGPGAQVVTPAGLVRLGSDVPLVVVGTGKTAFDTCGWLLAQGCPPDRITWVRTREAWLNNRHYLQPGNLSVQTVEGTVLWLEALAAAGSVEEVYERLEQQQVVFRVDPGTWPTVFRGPTLSTGELGQLRRITSVVRLGRLLEAHPGRMVLEEGEVPVDAGAVYVHCAAPGLSQRPPVPVFGPGRLTIQYLTRSSMSLSSAAIARVEALDVPVEEKNRLCPPTPPLESPLTYLTMLLTGLATENEWRGHPELGPWLERSRVNVTRRVSGREAAPRLPELYGRLFEAVGPAYANLATLSDQAG
jgi:hypothetical protein